MVDRSLEPNDGKIIIAAVIDELTEQRLALKNGHAWLMPENPVYEPAATQGGHGLRDLERGDPCHPHRLIRSWPCVEHAE